MTATRKLAAYLEHLAGVSGEDAIRRVPSPMLVQVGEEVEASDTGFHTDSIDPSVLAFALGRTDPSLREVIPVRKRGDGVFGGVISVGRTQNLDVVIARRGVSKFHAYFSVLEGGAYQLTDKNSTNGTYVDKTRLSPGVPQDVPDGSLVEFATYGFYFMHPRSFVRYVTSLIGR